MSNDRVFPVTQRLAEFAAGLDFERLPDVVRAQASATLIDVFRVAIAGVRMPWVAKVSDALLEIGGQPLCAILFSDRSTDPIRAAYVNGVIAGSLDWDDTHVGAMLHPGVVVWPAALAVGQMRGASGRQIVPAVVAGYEVMIRVGLSVQPDHFRRGFQSTATCGVFGAAATAARLLGLGVEATRDALGIAASYAGGTTQFLRSGSDVKRLHAGKASAAGVEAALLARAGLTGPADGIEGAQGFVRAFSDGFDAGVVEDGLGSRYRMLDITFRPHAGSARLQAAVEAACELARDGARAENITSVEIGIPAVIAGRLTHNDPADLQQAQLSVPFAVAMALALAPARGWPPTLTLDDFAESVKNENIRSLARQTRCVVDDKIDRATTTEYVPARVTLKLRDGRLAERTVAVPTGSPGRPMSFDELGLRFRAAAAGHLRSEEIDSWLQRALALENVQDAAQLMTLRRADR